MFWKSHSIKDGLLYATMIGPLKIQLKKASNEWYLAFKRDNQTNSMFELTQETGELTEEPAWTRWIVDSKTDVISFHPVMPDRSLVIRPEVPVKIPAGNRGTLYVNTPLWVKINIGQRNPVTLCEIPIQILSNSWFGDIMSGELCYSKKSMVRKNLFELFSSPCSAVCTVDILNSSKTELDFERFRLEVKNLAIFSDDERLWTSPVKVIFQGEDQMSQITISRSHPGNSKNILLKTKPREENDKNIIRKSFQFIKNLTSF